METFSTIDSSNKQSDIFISLDLAVVYDNATTTNHTLTKRNVASITRVYIRMHGVMRMRALLVCAEEVIMLIRIIMATRCT